MKKYYVLGWSKDTVFGELIYNTDFYVIALFSLLLNKRYYEKVKIMKYKY